MLKRRTDLALEAAQLWQESAGEAGTLPGVESEESTREGYPVTTVRIRDEAGARALGKPVGTYVTLELDGLARREEDAFGRAARALAAELGALLGLAPGRARPGGGPGQPGHHPRQHRPQGCRPDHGDPPPGGTGAGALRLLPAGGRPGGRGTGHHRHGERRACPRRGRNPPPRLRHRRGRPGLPQPPAGLPHHPTGRHRHHPRLRRGQCRAALNAETLGVPVIAVGVPTVVDAATLTCDVLAEAGKGELNPAALQGAGDGLIVTPKDIDTQVHDLAKVIGYGINLALHTGLTIEDVELFLS